MAIIVCCLLKFMWGWSDANGRLLCISIVLNGDDAIRHCVEIHCVEQFLGGRWLMVKGKRRWSVVVVVGHIVIRVFGHFVEYLVEGEMHCGMRTSRCGCFTGCRCSRRIRSTSVCRRFGIPTSFGNLWNFIRLGGFRKLCQIWQCQWIGRSFLVRFPTRLVLVAEIVIFHMFAKAWGIRIAFRTSSHLAGVWLLWKDTITILVQHDFTTVWKMEIYVNIEYLVWNM